MVGETGVEREIPRFLACDLHWSFFTFNATRELDKINVEWGNIL